MPIGAQVSEDDATEPPVRKFKEAKTAMWLNSYGNIRLSDRFSWIAQTHFRFLQTEETPFVGQIAQIYNRHAISYQASSKFRMSLGGVLRLNFNTDGVLPSERRAVPEWRIWHEYLFAQPLSRIKLYHRIRLEHRWSQDFENGSNYIFRNRWRYMIKLKMPLNNRQCVPGTFYVSPEAELIMQSGKMVVDSPMEDLRLHTSFGYVVNPQLTVASGLMYSMGQDLKYGGVYKQKWTARFHVYFTPDLRKPEARFVEAH
ncbi:MAG: DUF2490 domain-containing protein [Bacteroidota bacterium]